MPPIPTDAFQKRLAALPLATYQAGETVFAAGSKTGLLLILKDGAVAIIRDAVEIARVVEPGAVFGEMSALLDQPHTAEVRALKASRFHVADAATFMQDPISLLYMAHALARRLDVANQTLTQLKSQLREGDSPDMVGKTIEAIEGLLSASVASPAYSGSSKMRFFIER
jgi:CRP/FNR family transcriptional regulator, cyclic AMP receptor protein